jgi:hypothetical protein
LKELGQEGRDGDEGVDAGRVDDRPHRLVQCGILVLLKSSVVFGTLKSLVSLLLDSPDAKDDSAWDNKRSASCIIKQRPVHLPVVYRFSARVSPQKAVHTG